MQSQRSSFNLLRKVIPLSAVSTSKGSFAPQKFGAEEIEKLEGLEQQL